MNRSPTERSRLRRLTLLLIGLLALAGVAVTSSGGATQAQPHWVITDLGTLSGKTSEAVAINGRGDIIGTWSDPRWGKDLVGDPFPHGFLWQRGKMTDLGTLGGKNSDPTDLNERGQVVGSSTIPGGESASRHAFLWERGKMRDLGTLGGKRSWAVAINERGQVIANAETGKGTPSDPVTHAVLWQGKTERDLGTLGGRGSEALAINGAGQVVGWAQTKKGLRHAFLWQRGKMTDLGTLSGKTSEAVAINSRGQITGVWWTRQRNEDGELIPRAFLWERGKMRDLGTLGDGYDLIVSDMSERGEIIGNLYDPQFQSRLGVLFANGKVVPLRGFGGEITWPTAINNSGQVVGWGDSSRGRRAFLWERDRTLDLGALSGTRSQASSINNREQIVGVSKGHAILWTLKR